MNSAFLLANAIRYGGVPDVAAWVRGARDRSSFLAAAIDHEPVAQELLRGRLATSADVIRPSARLRAASERADRPTLMAIAALLLEINPPPWLPIAVVDAEVRFEIIPSADLVALEWLQPELEQILIDVSGNYPVTTGVLALGVGRAAELVVLAALEGAQRSPIHVSEISDRFGYDIETAAGEPRRWEVKGCTERTAGTFHLSRNEFNKCRLYGGDWRLVQVEFLGAAVVAEHLTAEHVAGIKELSADEILGLAPPDSDEFLWEASARMTPRRLAWAASSLEVPPDIRLANFDALGREVLATRQPIGIQSPSVAVPE